MSIHISLVVIRLQQCRDVIKYVDSEFGIIIIYYTKIKANFLLQICSVGLGGSVIAITASICALSRIVYEFHGMC